MYIADLVKDFDKHGYTLSYNYKKGYTAQHYVTGAIHFVGKTREDVERFLNSKVLEKDEYKYYLS